MGCNFFDTNGTERFRVVNETYYKKVDGCIIVYDITNQKSFDAIESYFIPKIKEKCKLNIPVLILGNKNDMKEMRQISLEQGRQLALKYGFIFQETSSIEFLSASDIFQKIVEITIYFKKKENINSIGSIHIHNTNNLKLCMTCC